VCTRERRPRCTTGSLPSGAVRGSFTPTFQPLWSCPEGVPSGSRRSLGFTEPSAYLLPVPARLLGEGWSSISAAVSAFVSSGSLATWNLQAGHPTDPPTP